MTRKWCVGIPVVLVTITIAMATSAQPLRAAKVGDRMGSLVTGLKKVDGAALGSCSPGAPIVRYFNYVVPDRPADDDNASFPALTIGERIVAIVAYDEQNLSRVVAVYADMDGNGLITNVWPIVNVPAPCALMQGLRYQPGYPSATTVLEEHEVRLDH